MSGILPVDPATGAFLGQAVPNIRWKGCEEGQIVNYLADTCSGVPLCFLCAYLYM